MLPLDFHPVFRDELADAERFLDGQQPGLGADLVAAVNRVVTEVAANPYRYGFYDGDVRAGQATPFDYLVLYRVLPDRVRVLAVAHVSRNPFRWRRRV